MQASSSHYGKTLFNAPPRIVRSLLLVFSCTPFFRFSADNPCGHNNGGCDELCLLSATNDNGFACAWWVNQRGLVYNELVSVGTYSNLKGLPSEISYFWIRCIKVSWSRVLSYFSEIFYRFQVTSVLSQTAPKKCEKRQIHTTTLWRHRSYHDKLRELMNRGILSDKGASV